MALPLAIGLESRQSRNAVPVQRSEAEALSLGEQVLQTYLLSRIDGTVLRSELRSKRCGGYLSVTLCAECEEQIGKVVPIPVEK